MKLKPYSECKGEVMICPSILSADFANLGEDVRLVSSHADTIHVDVMDGVFVPNITIGMPVVKAIRSYTDLPIDVHLMIKDPAPFINDFAAAGADLITVHTETCPHLHRVTQQIRDAGCGVGVVINPATPLCAVEEILPEVDLILLMSVNPGFGGQKYIKATTDKIRRLRAMMDERGIDAHIQVDGGITTTTIKEVYEAGANMLVAGSACYGTDDPCEAITSLKRCALS
ncbi:MAG: ribulose-phosphate 3-epimerase [Fastidiosipilaceae bacterium]|jgi:ribulose-phosphate 3-epimerase